MSTKIYNGMRFKSSVSLMNLNRIYKDIRGRLIRTAQEEYYRINAKILESLYVYCKTGVCVSNYGFEFDQMDVQGMTYQDMVDFTVKLSTDWIQYATNSNYACDEFSFLSAHGKEDCKRLIISRKGRDDESFSVISNRLLFNHHADFSVSMSILPIHNKILMLPYAENDAFYKVLTENEYFEEYGYWNNTDPDENVSEEDWAERKRDWDEALEGIGIPAENGFTIKFLDGNSLHNVHLGFTVGTNLAPYFSPTEDLAYQAAKESYSEEIFAELLKKCHDKKHYQILRDVKTLLQDHDEDVKKRASEYQRTLNILRDLCNQRAFSYAAKSSWYRNKRDVML